MPAIQTGRELIRKYLAGPHRPRGKTGPIYAPSGESQEASFGELSTFEQVIDVLSRPMYASASAAKALVEGNNPFSAAVEGFSGKQRTTYSDVLKSAGMDDGIARSASGFALDILLDPTTYIGAGPVREAGAATVRGVTKYLSKGGAALREAMIVDKVAQAARISGRLAETGKKALPVTKKAFEALLEKLPPAEKAILAKKVATPAEAVGAASGRRAFERALGSETRLIPEQLRGKVPMLAGKAAELAAGTTPAKLLAPEAIKIGIPFTKIEAGLIPMARVRQVLKPAVSAYKLAEKIPVVGGALKGARELAQYGHGFLKKVFSTKTGYPELDIARNRARDIEHLKSIESAEWWVNFKKTLHGIADAKPGLGESARDLLKKDLDRELVQTLEGIEREVLVLENPVKRQRALAAITKRTEGRINELLGREAGYKAQEALFQTRVKLAQAMVKPEQVGREVLEELGRSAPEIRREIAAKAPKTFIEGLQQNLEMSRQWLTEAKGTAAPEVVLKAKADVKNAEEALRVAKKGLKGGKKVEGLEEARQAVQESIILREYQKRVPKKIAALQEEIRANTVRLSKVGPNARKRATIFNEIERLQTELAREQASVKKLAEQPVLYRKRVPYEPAYPEVKPLVQKFRERMEMILTQEKKLLTLPPEKRTFYFPHFLLPEIKDSMIEILRMDAKALVFPEKAAFVQSAMRRTSNKDVLQSTIEDFITSGFFDATKIKAEFERRGFKLSSTAMLAFEADPVVAGLKRELSSIRAVTAAEQLHEILSSPTFVKAEVNVADYDRVARIDAKINQLQRAKIGAERTEQWRLIQEEMGRLTDERAQVAKRLQDYKQVLEQNAKHAIFVPTRDYIRLYRTPQQIEELRRGGEPGLIHGMLQEITAEERLTAAARGASLGMREVKGYIIPKEIAEHLSRAYAIPQLPEEVVNFLKKYDATQGWWKLFATAPRPAFHIRNFVSNLWQNFLAGVVSPKPYIYAAMLAKAGPEGRAKMAGIGAYSAEQVWELLRHHGIFKSGFVGSDLGEFIQRIISPVGLTPKRGYLKGIPGAGLIHPAGPAARAGLRFGTIIEDNARAANFIDGLMKNMDPISAEQRVKKYLFDYGDLTAVEKGVFRRLVPFYTWTRKSIPLAIETIIHQPQKVAGLGKLRAEFDQSVGGLDHEYVAEYINKAFGIPVWKDSTGQINYFLLKGYIPTVDLAKLDGQELLSMISPLLKEPLEQALNTDFFRMKPIARTPGLGETVEFMGAPMPSRVAHLLQNVVILSEADRLMFRPDASPTSAGLAAISFRTQSQNPVDQIRRFVMNTQFEIGELRRAAERAAAEGKTAVAASLNARVNFLTARRDRAKAQVLQLDPNAFKINKEGIHFKKGAKTRAAAGPKIDVRRLIG